jgi:hypothetical protein
LATAVENEVDEPDDVEAASVLVSTETGSSMSTVPTIDSELSTKARLGEAPTIAKAFNYDTIDWSLLSGFSIPIKDDPKALTSNLWQYGVPLEHGDSGARFWLCTECHANKSHHPHRYSVQKGSSTAVKHLREKHGIRWGKDKVVVDSGSERSDSIELDANIPREQAYLNQMARSFSRPEFMRLLMRWIVYDNVSFRQVDSPAFRDFVRYLCPCASDSMPTANTIRDYILKSYRIYKHVVKQSIAESLSKIHISFDLWTSDNNTAINGVTATFVDTEFEPHTIVLGIPEQQGAHTGDNIGSQIIEILKDYGITEANVGYFMLDNATNNDTAMDTIAEVFSLNKNHRRLRCAGHIINLIARSLLYGFDKDLFEQEELDAGLADLEDVEEELEHWRRAGPVGKAHNLVVWIYASPQRKARFHEGKLLLRGEVITSLSHKCLLIWPSSTKELLSKR